MFKVEEIANAIAAPSITWYTGLEDPKCSQPELSMLL
jgi:hypothetical protein